MECPGQRITTFYLTHTFVYGTTVFPKSNQVAKVSIAMRVDRSFLSGSVRHSILIGILLLFVFCRWLLWFNWHILFNVSKNSNVAGRNGLRGSMPSELGLISALRFLDVGEWRELVRVENWPQAMLNLFLLLISLQWCRSKLVDRDDPNRVG